MTARILFIEDDDDIRANVLELLEAEGMVGIAAPTGEAGLALALEDPPDLILCDITLPGMNGYDVLRAVSEYPQTEAIPFVFLSARAERSEVRHGMNLGASDYITKPFARIELLDAIRSRLALSAGRRPALAAGALGGASGGHGPSGEPLGTASGAFVLDPAMKALYGEAARVAAGDIAILVLGETGSGKEILANEVHQASPRASKPFMAFNCAALTETLLESELFGHERGSFTGAHQAQPGLFETAHGATVFLDEVGDIPLTTQVKLLRVLEEKKVLRVGSRVARPIDVRILSATNRDLEREVAQGRFRADLFYRLGAVALTVPPLRERVVEILPLAERFLGIAARQAQKLAPALEAETVDVLQRYAWPGNIRELRNVMERALLLSSAGKLEPRDLPARMTEAARASVPPPLASSTPPGTGLSNTKAALEAEMKRVEKQEIIDALAACAGNQTQAAARLGISRRTLVTRLSELELPRPRKRA